MDDTVAPPVGIEPEHVWRRRRFYSVAATVMRYADSDQVSDAIADHLPKLREWTDELVRHVDWFRVREREQRKQMPPSVARSIEASCAFQSPPLRPFGGA
jgi:hypothetical protein